MGKLEEKLLESFLREKEELLDRFKNTIGLKTLNCRLEELNNIEKKAFNNIEDGDFAYLYNIYIGEVILNYIDGRWAIGCLKKDAYHLPIILKSDVNKMRLCPMVDWFDLLKKDRLPEGISGMVKKVIEYERIL